MFMEYVRPTKQRGVAYRWHAFTHTDYANWECREYWNVLQSQNGAFAIMDEKVQVWVRENIAPENFRFEFRWLDPSTYYLAMKFRRKSDAMMFKLAMWP